MGGKPSKGTPADRRLKTNKPAPVKQPAKTAARPVKPMPRRGR